jgi:hypothetical protein
MNGLAGDDMNGLAGDDMNGLAGDDMNGLAGDDMNGLAGDDMNGLAGDDMNGLAPQPWPPDWANAATDRICPARPAIVWASTSSASISSHADRTAAT